MGKCLLQVGDNIIDMFDSDGKPDEIGGHTGSQPFLRRQLLVGGGCGVNDQGLGITDIRLQGVELEAVDELFPLGYPALDTEADQGSEQAAMVVPP